MKLGGKDKASKWGGRLNKLCARNLAWSQSTFSNPKVRSQMCKIKGKEHWGSGEAAFSRYLFLSEGTLPREPPPLITHCAGIYSTRH